MRRATEAYVLDTSASLAFEDEEGADIVEDLLERANAEEITIFLCPFMEVCYITLQGRDEREA